MGTVHVSLRDRFGQDAVDCVIKALDGVNGSMLRETVFIGKYL